MKTVSIINFKGGVGKTTLSLHLAAFLARDHRVLLIDVDHQSSLSIVVLGAPLWEKCVKQQNTVNRVFESFCNRKIAMPKTEIVINNAFGQRDKRYEDFYPQLDFVSAQFELDDTEIDLASTNYGMSICQIGKRGLCWQVGLMALMLRNTTTMWYLTALQQLRS